ncbi:XRE family transcriptional regulator [Streptomyces sp. GLT-R25]
MDETTRHPLVVARCAAGMTMEEFVSAIHAAASRRNLRSGIDDARVRKWHRGVIPNDESQIYVAEALGWPADIVRANDWPNWLPLTADGVVPLGPHSSVPALREALRTAMDRRTLFTISGATLSALAADWAAGPTSALAQACDGKPIGDDFVTFLESTVEYLTGLATEQRQHAPALLDAHLSTVTELLERGRYTPALGLRLHTLAASLSQTVAWHSFDLGRHTTASQNWIAGLHNAHAAGDHDLGAGLLGDLAYQAAWRGDHTTAASILHHALTRAQNPAARCLLPAAPGPHPGRTRRAKRTTDCAARPRRGRETPQRRRHRPARLVRVGLRSRPRRGLRPSPPGPRRHRPRASADHRR